MPRPSRLSLIAVLTLIALLVFGTISATPSLPPWTGSVLVLQDEHNEPFCTAFVIDKPRRLLLTADHCMNAVQQGKAYVRGAEVREVFHLPGADIAVVQADEGAVVLPPALRPDITPIRAAGEKFYSAGFSGGMRVINLEVVMPSIQLNPMSGPFIVYMPDIRPGMSGGPVVRWPPKGPVGVVGVNSMTHPRGHLSLTRPFDLLYPHLKAYFELPPLPANTAPGD